MSSTDLAPDRGPYKFGIFSKLVSIHFNETFKPSSSFSIAFGCDTGGPFPPLERLTAPLIGTVDFTTDGVHFPNDPVTATEANADFSGDTTITAGVVKVYEGLAPLYTSFFLNANNFKPGTYTVTCVWGHGDFTIGRLGGIVSANSSYTFPDKNKSSLVHSGSVLISQVGHVLPLFPAFFVDGDVTMVWTIVIDEEMLVLSYKASGDITGDPGEALYTSDSKTVDIK